MNVDTAMRHNHILVTAGDVAARVHGAGRMGRANAWLAVKVTSLVGSMWCAYLFAVLALVSLPSALSTGNTVVIVAWISQTFLQLVLLSVIMVGQNVQAAGGEARAQADHQTLLAIHSLTADVHTINEQQSEILRRLDAWAEAGGRT